MKKMLIEKKTYCNYSRRIGRYNLRGRHIAISKVCRLHWNNEIALQRKAESRNLFHLIYLHNHSNDHIFLSHLYTYLTNDIEIHLIDKRWLLFKLNEIKKKKSVFLN